VRSARSDLDGSANGTDPDRISSTVTVRVARDHAASLEREMVILC
jgi:hypothetical protein